MWETPAQWSVYPEHTGVAGGFIYTEKPTQPTLNRDSLALLVLAGAGKLRRWQLLWQAGYKDSLGNSYVGFQ